MAKAKRATRAPGMAPAAFRRDVNRAVSAVKRVAASAREGLALPPSAVRGPITADVLDRVTAIIAKNHGGVSPVVRLTDPRAYLAVTHVISTGLPALDAALGCGGLPGGKIIQIVGDESTGKSTLCNHLVAMGQQQGWVVKKSDKEQAGIAEIDEQLGIDRALSLGDDPEAIRTLENVWASWYESIEACATVGVPFAGILDSIPGTLSKEEIDLDFDDPARRSRTAAFLASKLPQLRDRMRADNVIILVNQTRDVQNPSPYQRPTKAYGGRALRFFTDIQLWTSHVGRITRGDKVVGMKMRVQVTKNKVAPPFRIAELAIYYEPFRIVDPATEPLPARPRPPRTPV